MLAAYLVSGVSVQVSENREPQNTKQGIMNVEGKASFIILNFLIDFRYSKIAEIDGCRVSGIIKLKLETDETIRLLLLLISKDSILATEGLTPDT